MQASRPATYNSEDWRTQAACTATATAVFFAVGQSPDAASLTEEAKRVCRGCSVRDACLEFAVTTNQEYGVWGGADEDERRSIRRRWRSSLRNGR